LRLCLLKLTKMVLRSTLDFLKVFSHAHRSKGKLKRIVSNSQVKKWKHNSWIVKWTVSQMKSLYYSARMLKVKQLIRIKSLNCYSVMVLLSMKMMVLKKNLRPNTPAPVGEAEIGKDFIIS